MNIISPSSELLAMTGHPELSYQYQPHPERLMEVCGRTCYKSETKITNDSAKRFIDNLRRSKHLTILEHSWQVRLYDDPPCIVGNWNKYLHLSINRKYIAGSVRAFEEAERQNPELQATHELLDEDSIRLLTHMEHDPGLMAATVRIITDRGVSHEQVRHRPTSPSQESTRYVNYTKRGMEVMIPPWVADGKTKQMDAADVMWHSAMYYLEAAYNHLIELGWTPQQARTVLPQSTKTELCITASLQEWQHIFGQRVLALTGAPHPQMLEVMTPLYQQFAELEPSFFSSEAIKRTFE